MTKRKRAPNQFRPVAGKRTMAISRSSGWRVKLRDIRQDPNTGEFRHKSEIDPYDPGGVDIPMDKLMVRPVLTEHMGGPFHINPFQYGHPEFAIPRPNEPILNYRKHIQHPEDHFYIWRNTRQDISRNFVITDQEIGNSVVDVNDLDGNGEITTPIIMQNENFYLFIAVHHSRTLQNGLPFNSFNIGRPNGYRLEQRGLWVRANMDATIYDEDYHVYVTNQWMNMFDGGNDNNYYWELVQ